VEGRIALEAAIQGTPIKNLHVLPAGNKDLISDPADALRWILSRLRDRFDAVLVDAPSWSDEADATFRTLAAAADAIYLVVHAGEVDQQKVRTLMRDLGRLGGHLGGLIVMR
jgi:Mrp family chromosome partitioning ATPase